MRSVTFYTWDFGGQEEYYVTHQCFLSTRSLYLVVWNVMEGEVGIDQLGPWLHNIQVRGLKGINWAGGDSWADRPPEFR
jgi:GTPase SAR1 family protein